MTDDGLQSRAVLVKGGLMLDEVADPGFLDALRVDGLVDRVCDRCREPYLTRRGGTVCAGCLTEDERRVAEIMTLREALGRSEAVNREERGE